MSGQSNQHLSSSLHQLVRINKAAKEDGTPPEQYLRRTYFFLFDGLAESTERV